MIVKHLSVRGWFRLEQIVRRRGGGHWFQSPRGEGVVQTRRQLVPETAGIIEFQSPRGEGVVQTANPQACMVMRQTRI